MGIWACGPMKRVLRCFSVEAIQTQAERYICLAFARVDEVR